MPEGVNLSKLFQHAILCNVWNVQRVENNTRKGPSQVSHPVVVPYMAMYRVYIILGNTAQGTVIRLQCLNNLNIVLDNWFECAVT